MRVIAKKEAGLWYATFEFISDIKERFSSK